MRAGGAIVNDVATEVGWDQNMIIKDERGECDQYHIEIQRSYYVTRYPTANRRGADGIEGHLDIGIYEENNFSIHSTK